MYSYAQNFEDVILARVFKHISKGHYLDIGAWHPTEHSVSYWFYRNGWRGAHVEPAKRYAQLLRQQRPDELIIERVVDHTSRWTTFFEVENTGLSTIDESLAERLQNNAFIVKKKLIQTTTLDKIFSCLNFDDIHWMKIDAEGSERSILRGWNKSKVRPWLILIEAINPETNNESHLNWESYIINKEYDYMYFDGLNRFYLHRDHKELSKFLKSGPCIFDEIEEIDILKRKNKTTEISNYTTFEQKDSFSVIQALLCSCSEKRSIDELLDDVTRQIISKFPSPTPTFLYELILQRFPESTEVALHPLKNPDQYIRNLILSDEFKSRSSKFIMDAFPNKIRDFFIHIPKTGGSSVRSAYLESNYIDLPSSQYAAQMENDEYYHFLTATSDRVFLEGGIFSLHGHPTAEDLLIHNLKRYNDHVFSIVRNPISLIISLINFILTRVETSLNEPQNKLNKDVLVYASALNYALPSQIEDKYMLVETIIEKLLKSNPICKAFYASGNARDALNIIYRMNIEIVDYNHLGSYLSHRGWNLHHSNVSTKFIDYEGLPNVLKSRLLEMTKEDLKLFQTIRPMFEAGVFHPYKSTSRNSL